MEKNKKINVLQLITGLGKGGAEKVIFDLCRKFDQKEFDISVLAFGERDDLLQMFKDNNINTNFYYCKSLKSLIGFARYLTSMIKSQKIDIIHAHLFHALLFSCISKISSPKTKVVFTSHSNLGSKFREFLIFCLRPFRDIDIIFSEKQRQYYDKGNAQVIENGIESSQYVLNLSKNDIFTFINIARIEDIKNHDGLITMVKKIETDIPFEVQIVGDGYLRESLESRVLAENLEQKIKFLGYRTDIKELCNKAHVFILPSIWEGLPIALLEAGACGLPVISTPVGSIPSVIDDQNGYLADEHNFGETMKYVIDNYAEAKMKGQKLQKKIQTVYDISVMVEKHRLLYKIVSKKNV